MPKAHKPKATPPHRMVLRSQGPAQTAISAGPPQFTTTASSTNSVHAAVASRHHKIPSPSSLTHKSSNPQSGSPTFPLTLAEHPDEEISAAQSLVSGSRFPEDSMDNLKNLEAQPPIPENVGAPVVSQVSRLRREFAHWGNLDSPSLTDEDEATQLNTQATPVQTQVVVSVPFSARAPGELGYLNPSTAATEPSTQVVTPQAPFTERMLRELGNVAPVQVCAQETGAEIAPSQARFSRRMIAELGNVDHERVLATQATTIDEDDYDDGATIRDLSQILKSPTPPARQVDAASSEHAAIKSWASRSLTTSMREFVGLPPKPLKGGKLRPVPEDLGPAPPRWPCEVTIMHPTCGHTYKIVAHSHICYYYDEKPGERVYRDPTPELEVLDEWGLPPSAQPPARMQGGSSGSKTQVITEDSEDCFESTSSFRLTGRLCEECQAEHGERG